MPEIKRILFLCTGNSCRSQMAEGWCRTLGGEHLECDSAGLEAHGINPLAAQVMAETGVDISSQQSNTILQKQDIPFDLVVTVCGHAHEHCPVWPADATVLHMPFDDPPLLARDAANEEEALVHYRRVRDEIREAMTRLVQEQVVATD